MSATEGHPSLTIEDDGVQHYVEGRELHVYDPSSGVFRVERGGVGYVVSFYGGPPAPAFYEVVAQGSTLAVALRRAMESTTRGENVIKPPGWHDRFAARVEGWLA